MSAIGAAAVIFPVQPNFLAAIEATLECRPPQACLYTDGERVAWLPRALPGWFRIHAAIRKEPLPCAA